MKTFIKVLAGFFILILLVLITALFTKKDYTIEKEAVISKPRQEIFDYVKMLQHQNEFSAWYRLDPAVKTTVSGPDGEAGSVYMWDSEKTGQGEKRTTQVANGERLQYEITFIKPWEGKAFEHLYFETVSPTETKVKNTFSSSMPYPMNVMLLFMNMDNTIGKEMQNGLNNLKTVLESR